MQIDSEPHDRHWIRLRGPWEVTWCGSSASSSGKRVKLPLDWRTLFGEQTGTAQFRRRFQTPSQLGELEHVCITLFEVQAHARCEVNGHVVPALEAPLGSPECWPAKSCLSFDITEHLQSSNQLTLELTVDEFPPLPIGLHEPVLLEIVTLEPGADD